MISDLINVKTWGRVLTIVLCLPNLSLVSVPQEKPNSPRSVFKIEKLRFDNEEVTILRDDFGVPHVFADSQRGASYGGGYAVAQDRLFQLERLRRQARGQLAEIEGARATLSDRQVRINGYSEAELQSQFDALPGEIKQTFEAYTDGINAYIRKAAQAKEIPSAFKEVGLTEPEPWKQLDSAAISIMAARWFSSHGGSETQNIRILKWLKTKFGDAANQVFDDLFWIDDPQSPTSIVGEPPKSSGGPNKIRRALRPGQVKGHGVAQLEWLNPERLNNGSLTEATDTAQQKAAYEYADENQLLTRWGSFACVIAPKRSVSGNAILLGGPQMNFSAPALVYEIHYSAKDLNVIGVSIPGTPVVAIGHNDYLAWTSTSGFTDMVDIFAEQLNPQNKRQYWHKGKYLDMERRVEEIKVRGSETPTTVEIYRTVHGPVVSWDEQAGVAYTRAAAFSGHELVDVTSTYQFNRARNLQEFAAAAANLYTNRNYLAATVTGDIGYWHCGKPPLRASGGDPRLPTPGTGEYDWVGLTPFSKMPQVVNPEQGFIVNWNNKPTKSWKNGDQAEWGSIHLVTRIEQLVKAQKKMSVDQVREIAQDISVFDIVAHDIKPYLLAALEKTEAGRRDSRLRQALAYMQSWDEHIRDRSVAAAITRMAINALRDQIFADDFDGMNSAFPRFGGDSAMQHFVQMSLVLRALQGKESRSPLSRDYLNGRDKNELIIEAINKSLDLSTKVVGPQMNLWKWQQCEMYYGSLPAVPRANTATYLEVIELSQPMIQGESVLPPGQSENPRSPHYGDQREMAAYWRFKEMLYKREQFEKTPLRDIECQPRRSPNSEPSDRR